MTSCADGSRSARENVSPSSASSELAPHEDRLCTKLRVHAEAAASFHGSPDLDRLLLPLGRDRLERLEADRAVGRAHRRGVDDYSAHWRRSLETGCGIDDVARHDPLATLRTSAESNNGLARRHGRSNGDVEALASESLDRLEDAKRSPDRTLCVVLVRGGCSEDGHDGISDELLDRAAEALDVCLDALVVRPERGAYVLRVGAVGTVREADEIDEQHRDDLAFLSCGNLCRQRLTAGQAEARSFWVLLAAVRTDDHAPEAAARPRPRRAGAAARCARERR